MSRIEGHVTPEATGHFYGHLTHAARHDLPPLWEGRPVMWHGWGAGPPVLICPPPARECCQFCGSLEPSVSNRGSREVIVGSRRFMPSLIAHRCPDCRRDLVHDMGTDETWELEPSDYDDGGA